LIAHTFANVRFLPIAEIRPMGDDGRRRGQERGEAGEAPAGGEAEVSWRLALTTTVFWAMVALGVYLAIDIPDCGMRENYGECASSKRAGIVKFVFVSTLLYVAGLYVRHRYRNC
jgi:hypothetical protein